MNVVRLLDGDSFEERNRSRMHFGRLGPKDLVRLLRDAFHSDRLAHELAGRIEAAVGTKWAGHQINKVEFVRPAKSMSQIGG